MANALEIDASGRITKIKLLPEGIALVLFVIALALRVVYIEQAQRNDPGYSVFLPAEDMYQHDVTAKQFSKGNFAFSVRSDTQTSTFYPYFLALLYKISDANRHFARLFQAVLSSLSVVLLYMIAIQFMSLPFAAICGLMLAFYGPAIFYSGILLPCTLIGFLYLLTLWWAVKHKETRSNLYILLAAMTLGLCIVARPNNIIIFPFFLIWLSTEKGSTPAGRRAAVAVALAAVSIAPALWALKSLILETGRKAEFSIGLHMFLIGNSYDSMGIYYYSPSSAVEILNASGGSYFRGLAELAQSILAHPAQWVWAETRKFAAFWIGYEANDNVSYGLSRQFSTLLMLPLPSFSMVSSLGLLGMAIRFREWKRFSLLYLMAFGTFLSIYAFIILSRYRLVIVPMLILFSGLALESIWLCVSSRKYANALGMVASGIALLFLTRSSNITLLYPIPYLTYFESMARHNLALTCITDNRFALGESQLKQLIESDPHFPAAYVTYAVLCESQGRSGEALRIIEQGLRNVPTNTTLLWMKSGRGQVYTFDKDSAAP